MGVDQVWETVMAAEGTVPSIAKVGLVLLFTYLVAHTLDRFLKQYHQGSSRVSMGKTSFMLLRRLLTVAVYVIGVGVAVYAVPELRNISLALFASAGFIGIVLGLAAQSALSNVISGVFLILFQPFRIDDIIETQNHYGTVEDITLRHTVIQTPANERVVVPNAQISEDYIINYSIRERRCRYDIPVGISYGSDIDTARELMLDTAENHDNTINGESEVIVKDLSDSSVVLELRIWAADRITAWRAGQDLREAIKKRFDQEDITIPFPQRTVSYLNEAR